MASAPRLRRKIATAVASLTAVLMRVVRAFCIHGGGGCPPTERQRVLGGRISAISNKTSQRERRQPRFRAQSRRLKLGQAWPVPHPSPARSVDVGAEEAQSPSSRPVPFRNRHLHRRLTELQAQVQGHERRN